MKLICGFSLLALGAVIVALVCAVSVQQVQITRLQQRFGDLSDKVGRVGSAVSNIPPEPLPLYVNPIRGPILASRHK